MSRHVPLVKKCLEDLIFRVKAMLRANNSQDLFVLGTLKIKTLRAKRFCAKHKILMKKRRTRRKGRMKKRKKMMSMLTVRVNRRMSMPSDLMISVWKFKEYLVFG